MHTHSLYTLSVHLYLAFVGQYDHVKTRTVHVFKDPGRREYVLSLQPFRFFLISKASCSFSIPSGRSCAGIKYPASVVASILGAGGRRLWLYLDFLRTFLTTWFEPAPASLVGRWCKERLINMSALVLIRPHLDLTAVCRHFEKAWRGMMTS